MKDQKRDVKLLEMIIKLCCDLSLAGAIMFGIMGQNLFGIMGQNLFGLFFDVFELSPIGRLVCIICLSILMIIFLILVVVAIIRIYLLIRWKKLEDKSNLDDLIYNRILHMEDDV